MTRYLNSNNKIICLRPASKIFNLKAETAQLIKNNNNKAMEKNEVSGSISNTVKKLFNKIRIKK
jgi:hypothetical protein